jgi:predicted TIM-barrel fold metal-dependent hydrolase
MVPADPPAAAPAAAIPDTAPPDLRPRPPRRLALPPLACDCHAHICGPRARYPYYARRLYTPADALLPDYRRMQATLGVERAVLVQGSIYGTDNTVLLEALRAAGPGFRGVAVLPEDIGERELRALHEAGVRGVRVNIVDTRDAKGVLPLARLLPLAQRIRPLGWHVEFLLHVDEFPELDRLLAGFPVEVVFGHLGYMRTDRGLEAPGFRALLRLLRDGRAWVKLTAPYRISATGLPHAEVVPYAHALLAAAPERVVWGTDWPHVKAEWTIPMPNDGELADLLADWVPEAALRERVLVDNPARLYGFD